MVTKTSFDNLINPDLSIGIAANYAQTAPFIAAVPMQPVEGLVFKARYATSLGGTQWVALGDTLTGAKTSAAYSNNTYDIKRVVADIVTDTIHSDGSLSAGSDLDAQQVLHRSIELGGKIATSVYTGAYVSSAWSTTEVLPLRSHVDATDGVYNNSGAALSFVTMDETANKVRAKGGQVDFFTMGLSLLSKYKQLYRTLGGTVPEVVWTNPYTGVTRNVIAYEGIPIFGTTFLGFNENADGKMVGDTGFDTDAPDRVFGSIYAGTFDTGAENDGIAFKYLARTKEAQGNLGLVMYDVGAAESQTTFITRMEHRLELVNHNKYSVARAINIIA